MQRTYKSKKDTGGGLDLREVIFSLDDKSSAFDAFYIQNIKQTKREQSCVSSSNQYNSAANKVRKRKYVRRIVKEVDRIPECSTKSSYLTPDKSIHVNRGQDLFDQLLNSSSPTGNETIKTNKNDLFDKLKLSKEKNNYSRKKITKTRIKKNNYSSSDSTDSDKENSSETKPQNATNIGKHVLVIEREPKKSSPYCQDQDDSINQIANNLSLINNITDTGTPKNYKSCAKKYGNNRLTENIIQNQNSPLCSTPFMEKYRGKSIYKFSPISMGNLDESKAQNVDHMDSNEKEKSIVLFDSNEIDSLVVSKNNIHVPSPVLKCSSKSMFNNSSGHSNVSRRKKKSNNSLINNSIYKEDRDEAVKQDVKNNIDSLIHYSTDVTPLLGFINNTLKHVEDPAIIVVENEFESSMNTSPRKSLVLPASTKTHLFKKVNSSKTSNSNSSSDKSDTSVKSNKSVKIMDITSEEHFLSSCNIEANQMSIEDEPFLGFSTNTILKAEEIIDVDKSNFDSDENSTNDITMVESEIPKQREEIETENKLSISIEDNTCYEDKFITFSSTRKTVATESLTESDIDGQSHYDTCDSLDRFSDEDCEPKSKIPVVVLERMSLSNLEKHRSKTASDSSSSSSNNSSAQISYTDNSSKELEDSSNDTDTESNISSQNSSTGTDSFRNEESYESKEEIEELATQASGSQSNEDERNFVTQRRRNDAVNNSSLLVLDESVDTVNTSTSTEEADTTVQSKLFNKRRPGKSITEDLISDVLSRDDVTESFKNLVKNFRMSVADRNASRKAEDATACDKATVSGLSSISHDVSKLDKTVMEAAIVLQPGKKWERSLSIYRRMTTMSTCDGSLLEDDELEKKGRKYRQSVIETMEMQPHKGPLHNESFQSCRSSIVSNPHRATIKIIKDPNSFYQSHHSSSILNDLTGFLHEDCDDTVVELSKLSISGSELEVTIVENVHESERLTSARDFVLRRCNQTEPILFDECYPDTVLKNCHKIGEGVYGEVYLWRARDGRARVMKVVPIAGTTKVNGEHQKDFHEVISEIVIAMELSALRAPIADIENHLDEGKDIASLDLHSIENATDCFNEVLAVRCVYGSYPSRLLDLWDLFDEVKGSENDNPAVLPADQQFLVLELANAGQDLESYQFNNAEQAHALFMQVAFALAVGEEAFQFEHRDLHWGNVLIAPTDQKYATFVLRGRSYRVPRRGVAATIIDYSLSRAALPVGGDRVALYNDLAADEELFAAVGDKQFEVYRSMREHTGNDWKVFEPYTNILWLEYVADKMITALRYKRVNTKVHKHYIAKLKGIKDRILTHRSAVQFVLTDNEF